jgi:hypothetical protein
MKADSETLYSTAAQMREIVVGNPKSLSFETIYRAVYERSLNRENKLIQSLIRFSIRLMLTSTRPKMPATEMAERCTMLSDVTLYHQRTYIRRTEQPDVRTLFAEEQTAQVQRAQQVLGKYAEVWLRRYYKPGNTFERHTALLWAATTTGNPNKRRKTGHC